MNNQILVIPNYKKQSSVLKLPKAFSKETHPQQITFDGIELKKQSNLSLFERFKLRVKVCPDLIWVYPTCKTENCNHKLTKKPIKLSCLSPYCNDVNCISNRVRCVNFRLKEFDIKAKQLYNFVIGFKPIKTITKKEQILYQKIFRYFMKELILSYQKRFKAKLYAISTRDINLSKNGLRLHYHIATLPIKDFRELTFMIKSSCEKAYNKFNIHLAPSFSGYKKTSSTLSYFSKRVSGLFGHNRKGEQQFTYKNIMSVEDYFSVFYKTKALNFFNLKFRSREARTELISMLNVIPKICPKCNEFTKYNIIFLQYERKPPPPPPTNETKAIIEYVSIIENSKKHPCKDCNHKFYLQDYNIKTKSCVLCSVRNTSFAYKKAHELEHKLPEVAKMYKKESDYQLKNMVEDLELFDIH